MLGFDGRGGEGPLHALAAHVREGYEVVQHGAETLEALQGDGIRDMSGVVAGEVDFLVVVVVLRRGFGERGPGPVVCWGLGGGCAGGEGFEEGFDLCDVS